MIGTHCDNVVADAIVKGLTRAADGTPAYDVGEAFRVTIAGLEHES